jgi:hypothetical protein
MLTSLLFGCGVSLTFLVALGIVGYLNGPLRKQLLELCGNADRVAFWAAFANVTVVLTPAIFAMSVEPGDGAAQPPVLAIAQQMKWGFVGLVFSILLLGWILSRFIPRKPLVSGLPQSGLPQSQLAQAERA